MRDATIRALCEIAGEDSNVILMTADLGFGVFDEFRRRFPRQFVNAGIAEQNMTGLAAGLALEGKVVFTYSIGNFPTLRCLEQIRNDVCYHGANVKIIATGGGFTYGSLGISHHATEDLAIMRTLPEMKVIAPGDSVEAAAATAAIYRAPGPCYLRLGRGGEPAVHREGTRFELGKALKVQSGDEVAIISTGEMLAAACFARGVLAEEGIEAAIYSMHTVKPLDGELIVALASSTSLIVTVEEHSVIGGLGGAVAEVLAQFSPPRAQLKIIGLNDCFSSMVGDCDYLREAYGICAGNIAQTVRDSLGTEAIRSMSACRKRSSRLE